KNIVQFTGTTIGVPVSKPHLLNVNGVPVIPDLVLSNRNGFTVTANTVSITVTRTAVGGPDINVYVEHWHTIEDCEPPGGLASFLPFVVESGFSTIVAVNGGLTGDGSGGAPITLNAQHDASLTGVGTPLSPLALNVQKVDSALVGNGSAASPLGI